MTPTRFRPLRRAALLLSLLSLPASALAAMQAKPVEWKIGDQAFSGVLVYDDDSSDKRPGLVMVPNWMGVGEEAVAMARRVAGDDYVVLVADVYGAGIRPQDDAQALAAVKQAWSDGGATLRKRARWAVEVLKTQEGLPLDAARIGAIGFCFGGGVVLELARSGSDLAGGVVSFHGNLDSYRPVEGGIRTSILVLNGADDKSVDAKQIAAFEQEMDAAGADWQFVNFGGARHCSSQPEDADKPADGNCLYNERAAGRAFRIMEGFFDERFGGD
jgi:dienelactone hydrolase